jgi:hypothetical protein
MSSSVSSTSAADTSAETSYMLAVQNWWMTCNFENLLLIPFDSRWARVAIGDHAIAFATSSGVVLLTYNF